MEKNLKCLFCDKDLSEEKFRQDYILVAIQDVPDEPDSFTKVAKPCHPKCLQKFMELNPPR